MTFIAKVALLEMKKLMLTLWNGRVDVDVK